MGQHIEPYEHIVGGAQSVEASIVGWGGSEGVDHLAIEHAWVGFLFFLQAAAEVGIDVEHVLPEGDELFLQFCLFFIHLELIEESQDSGFLLVGQVVE